MPKAKVKIYSICQQCSEQLYPTKVLKSDKLLAITVCLRPCDICGVKRFCTPIRDYFFAITGEFWD